MNTSLTMRAQLALPAQPTRLHGRWLRIARLTWWTLAGYPVLLFLLGLAPALEQLRTPVAAPPIASWHYLVLSIPQARVLEASGISLELYATYMTALEVFQALAYASCGLLIFWRRSDELIALITSLTLVVLGVYLIPNTPGSAFVAYPQLPPLQGATFIWGNWLFPALLYLLPNGRFALRWHRWFFCCGAHTSHTLS
jgi:hypothetical protein